LNCTSGRVAGSSPRRGYSIFASGVYRIHAAKWLFPQEKTTFDALVMSTSEAKMLEIFEPELGLRFHSLCVLGAKPKVTVTEKLRPAMSPGVSPPLMVVVALKGSEQVTVAVALAPQLPGMVGATADPARERLWMLCESIRLVPLSLILVPSKMERLRMV
jgi:hypothetical protein